MVDWGGGFQDSSNSPRDKERGLEKGVTTGHFTKLMGWESLAAGAGREGIYCGIFFKEDTGAVRILSI